MIDLRGRRRRKRVEELVAQVPVWFHSIDLGDGIVTPGIKGGGGDYMQRELAGMRLPDLEGKTVLDVGAWDGFYSFEAERRGASGVVALDHHVWALDLEALQSPPASSARRGSAPGDGVPDRFRDRPEVWCPKTLPGKRGFDVAHEVLASRVETRVAEFIDTDPEALGSFDVVLFLGYLYHMPDPLGALRRLAEVTLELAVIETAAVKVGGAEDSALWELYGADELDGDPSNWWAPNAPGLESACLAAGFSEVEIVDRLGASRAGDGEGVHRLRLTAHARK